jgi:hypothetical protein
MGIPAGSWNGVRMTPMGWKQICFFMEPLPAKPGMVVWNIETLNFYSSSFSVTADLKANTISQAEGRSLPSHSAPVELPVCEIPVEFCIE